MTERQEQYKSTPEMSCDEQLIGIKELLLNMFITEKNHEKWCKHYESLRKIIGLEYNG